MQRRRQLQCPSTPAAEASSKPSAAAAAPITIKNFIFTVPASVAPGSKVTLMHVDIENHTVTSTARGAFAVQADASGGATLGSQSACTGQSASVVAPNDQ
ncbi:MAG: hypothetical protein ABI899_10800 [Actinomycetota bacterium]